MSMGRNLSVGLLLSACGQLNAQSVTFTVIPGGPRLPWAMSGNGNAVVGSGNFVVAYPEAWRWTRSGGMMQLGVTDAAATVASFDGAVVYGQRTGGTFRSSGGLWNYVPGLYIRPDGSSRTGNTLAGTGYAGSSLHAFLWNAESGVLDLGVLAGHASSTAAGISGDGKRVALTSTSASGVSRAVAWDAPSGLIDMGVPPGATNTVARGISADGCVIVGSFSGPGGVDKVAYRWSAAYGFQSLGLLIGQPTSEALSASINGDVIVGRAHQRLFIWTPSRGMQDLEALFTNAGVSLGGFAMSAPMWVSEDGQKLAGSGALGGYARAWAATLPQGFGCYANCDGSTSSPVLGVADFICFLSRFSAGDSYANCDQSQSEPSLNVADFVCFMNKYAVGCP